MKQENKVLIKKLMALIVSVALIIGVFPSNVFADTGLSAELVDYEETYYNGFNSDIAAATGTLVEVYDEADDESYYFLLDEPLERISGERFAVVPVQNGAYLVISHVGVYAQVNGVSFHHSLQFQR